MDLVGDTTTFPQSGISILASSGLGSDTFTWPRISLDAGNALTLNVNNADDQRK